ncbi:MAG: hypothetical protein ACFE7E_07420 [Candidatus Hodarchaeota archaeon]
MSGPLAKVLEDIASVLGKDNLSVDKTSDALNKAWTVIDQARGIVSDPVISRICEALTKLAVVLDAYNAKMINLDAFVNYIKSEEIPTNLNELASTVRNSA